MFYRYIPYEAKLYNQCLGNVTSTYDVYLGTIATTNCKNDCESEG